MLYSRLSWALLIRLCCFGHRRSIVYASPVTFMPRTVISNDTAATATSDPPYTGGYYTYTTYLPIGSIALEVPIGPSGFSLSTTTIYGPTSFTWVYPTVGAEVHAGPEPDNPHCNQTLTYPPANRYVTVASRLTVLVEGQTITTAIFSEQFSGTPPPNANYDGSLTTRTFTGPTTVSFTTVTDLFPFIDTSWGIDGGYPPGVVCKGGCGMCELFFPLVYVYYWPVTSPNTACLSTTATTALMSTSTAAAITQRDVLVDGIVVEPRGLSGLAGSGSTLVNSNGFTFTSPSVYIAFPTISAVDDCGLLGSVHTSTTLGFPAGAISTVVLGNGNLTYYPFDFADALCPPASLSDFASFSIIGQTGYNPVISPPAGITLIDPAWVADCRVPAFQGNDPPYALVPASNLSPSPTTVNLIYGPTPASPKSGVATQAEQTNPPKSATMFTPQKPTVTLNGPASKSTASQDPPGPQDPKDPPTNPKPTINAVPITTNAAAPLQIGSQTLIPGGPPVTLSGTTYALALSATALTINGVPTQLPKPPTPGPATIQVAGQQLTENSASAFIIGSQTLVPGSPPITVSNTPISLAPSASYVVIGSATQVLGAAPATPAPEAFTLAGQTFTGNAASGFVIGSQTLTPGGVITVAGTPVSLPAAGSYVLQGTATIPLMTLAPGPEVLTFAGQTYTANSASDFAISGMTLTPGGAITVSGVPISLAADPTVVVIGTSTQGLGALIVTPFRGGTGRTECQWGRVLGGLGVGVLALFVL